MVEDDKAAAAEIEQKDVQALEVPVGDLVGESEEKGGSHHRQDEQAEAVFPEELRMDGLIVNHADMITSLAVKSTSFVPGC